MALAVLTGASVLPGLCGSIESGIAWVASLFGNKTPPYQTCKCNKAAQVKVSITANDFGRRYMCCFHDGEANDCRHFEWIDPQIDGRVKDMINGFLKKVKSLESENVSLKSTNKEHQKKINTLKSTVNDLKLELAVEKKSLQLTCRALYGSLAIIMLLVFCLIVASFLV